MSASELQARFETVEVRLAHQEATLDELMRVLLEQERQLRDQSDTIQRLELQLRATASAMIAAPDEETPPPHY